MASTEANNVLSGEYTKIVVQNTVTGEEAAVITNDMITTADNFIVRMTPKYD